jgi:hypothetical protein
MPDTNTEIRNHSKSIPGAPIKTHTYWPATLHREPRRQALNHTSFLAIGKRGWISKLTRAPVQHILSVSVTGILFCWKLLKSRICPGVITCQPLGSVECSADGGHPQKEPWFQRPCGGRGMSWHSTYVATARSLEVTARHPFVRVQAWKHDVLPFIHRIVRERAR